MIWQQVRKALLASVVVAAGTASARGDDCCAPCAPATRTVTCIDYVPEQYQTTRTTYKTAPEGDLGAIGRFGLKSGDSFTLSFDSRPFPDGSFPLNYMNW